MDRQWRSTRHQVRRRMALLLNSSWEVRQLVYWLELSRRGRTQSVTVCRYGKVSQRNLRGWRPRLAWDDCRARTSNIDIGGRWVHARAHDGGEWTPTARTTKALLLVKMSVSTCRVGREQECGSPSAGTVAAHPSNSSTMLRRRTQPH
jgi:hypothetical protein